MNQPLHEAIEKVWNNEIAIDAVFRIVAPDNKRDELLDLAKDKYGSPLGERFIKGYSAGLVYGMAALVQCLKDEAVEVSQSRLSL